MAPDPRLDPATAQGRAGAEQLEVGSRALFLGRAYFGCIATVLPDVSRGLSKQVSFNLPFSRLLPWLHHSKGLRNCAAC
jgi:hypothetical protein